MSYNAVPTVATGDLWTAAQHNTYVRDNFAAGVPDIFTAAGDLAYATAANAATPLAIGAASKVLRSTGSAPAWNGVLYDTGTHAAVNISSIGGLNDGGSPTIFQVHGGAGYGLLILSSSATSASGLGGITFGSTGLSGSEKRIAQIAAAKSDASTTTAAGYLQFYTATGGVLSEMVRLSNSGVFVNDTSNAKAGLGVTINQGANDDEILAFKSSDVSHGMISLTEDDTYAKFGKASSTAGGVWFAGYSESNNAFYLEANVTTGNTTKTTSAGGAIIFNAAKKSGASSDVMGADENILVVLDGGGSARLILDADGDLHTHGGSHFVNDTDCADVSVGLVINQGTNDNQIVALKSSDVAHGIVTLVETDTFGDFRKNNATNGGLRIEGWSESNDALEMRGTVTTEDTTKANTSHGAVQIDGQTKTGSTAGAMGANANVLAIGTQVGVTTRFILDSDGDSHQDVGTAWTNFDDHDDISLLTALSVNVAQKRDPIRRSFKRWLRGHRRELKRLKLVTFNRNGHHFVNMSRLTMLLVGAVRQLAGRVGDLEAQLVAAVRRTK